MKLQKIIPLCFFFLFGIASTLACSCAYPLSPEKEFERADYIFEGTVLSINSPATFVQSTADPAEVTFSVHTGWKGNLSEKMIIQTARSDVSCGYPFVVDSTYIVYAFGDHKQTYLCSRTTIIAAADADLHFLGEGNITLSKSSLMLPKKLINFNIFIAVVLGSFFVIILSLFRKHPQ